MRMLSELIHWVSVRKRTSLDAQQYRQQVELTLEASRLSMRVEDVKLKRDIQKIQSSHTKLI